MLSNTDAALVDFRLVFSLGIPAVAAVIVNILGHYLKLHQESVNRRTEARLTGLEIAYKRLARFEFEKTLDGRDDTKNEFQRFVAEIQLWGTPSQRVMTLKIIESLVSQKTAQVIPLLLDLRDSLRRDLKFEPLPPEYLWIKFSPPEVDSSDRSVQSQELTELPKQKPVIDNCQTQVTSSPTPEIPHSPD